MAELWQQISSLLWSIIRQPTIADAIDIAIVAFLLYQLLKLTRDTRASQVLKGLGIVFVLYWASDWLGLKALHWILQLVVNSGAVVVVILFQSEIRRALEQIGRAGSSRLDLRRNGGTDDAPHIVDELVTALSNLARRRVGALVVIVQQTGLSEIQETGTALDARISAPLIENIFEPNTPLHDGAVILRGERIVSAACILPLSENPAISRELGTRHRAGIGVSETTDAVVLIVSEETGIISLCRSGRLTRHLDAKSLTRELTPIYQDVGSGANFISFLFAKSKPSKS